MKQKYSKVCYFPIFMKTNTKRLWPTLKCGVFNLKCFSYWSLKALVKNPAICQSNFLVIKIEPRTFGNNNSFVDATSIANTVC